MARSPRSPRITAATKLTPAEAERRIAVESVRYMEIRKPPKQLGNGLGALVRATFTHIAAMREKGLSWDEVREVFLRADALHLGIKSVQLAGEFRYQLRYREGRLRRRGKTVGDGHATEIAAADSPALQLRQQTVTTTPPAENSLPSALTPLRSSQSLPVPGARPERTEVSRVERDLNGSGASTMRAPEAAMIGMPTMDRVGEIVRLRDGREFPAGTEKVPLMAREKWSAKERFRHFGNAADASLEPPMVDIGTLL